MDVERVAPFNVLRSVYPEIPIAYEPTNKHIGLRIEDRLGLALLSWEISNQLKFLS